MAQQTASKQQTADNKVIDAETQHLDQETIAQREAVLSFISNLPSKLQLMVWQTHAVQHSRFLVGERTGYASVDYTAKDETGKVTGTKKVLITSTSDVAMFALRPVDYVFSTSLTNNPQAFRHWFAAAVNKVIFRFDSPRQIVQFATLLGRYFLPQEVPARIRLHLELFSSPTQFINMDTWSQLEMAHGDDMKAHEHVREWVEAVQILVACTNPEADDSVTVVVGFRRHWRDYRNLRGAMGLLRERNCEVKVRLANQATDKGMWASCPDPDFHVALTILSVHGTRMAERQDAITFAEAKLLVDFGCTGFRGLKY